MNNTKIMNDNLECNKKCDDSECDDPECDDTKCDDSECDEPFCENDHYYITLTKEEQDFMIKSIIEKREKRKLFEIKFKFIGEYNHCCRERFDAGHCCDHFYRTVRKSFSKELTDTLFKMDRYHDIDLLNLFMHLPSFQKNIYYIPKELACKKHSSEYLCDCKFRTNIGCICRGKIYKNYYGYDKFICNCDAKGICNNYNPYLDPYYDQFQNTLPKVDP